MGRAIDLFVTYRFIKLLVTPFNKTDAFELGIIDEKGKVEALLFICILVLITFFFRNLFRYSALYFLTPIRNGIVHDLRIDLHQNLQQHEIWGNLHYKKAQASPRDQLPLGTELHLMGHRNARNALWKFSLQLLY